MLVLFGGGYAVNELRSQGGPPVGWIEGDIALALQSAAPHQQLILVYLYEAGTPAAERNEREVFTKRWARVPLAQMVCVRKAVRRNDETALRYGYENQPLFLVLDATGKIVNRTAGTPEERQFYTYVSQTLENKPKIEKR
ncbi:hypothetical protein RAS1_00180 [Phycisphaerae bacterium RAS1]|nr:hypothetical protein RAS1_00180 [Phycisphaerae bacterium RAS1]